ncbi:DNA-binding transcriptional LysR family regulator [Pseudomonas duriflava]|uniref:DNA-binding transcriptional LysR family regulator n=1 Tax=Pseudomonas duriflava TaxID=459528 RepID=A0A562QFH9_9PSED|nr:LysR family transcriptional regulator [Pseudomonas duriflava]TWI54786.1 DNA-binding transcriptional LysR family regulator [Pseudomonas duriflava]
MIRLFDLQLFVRTVDCASLSAAAREMDLSPAVASAALKRLEQALDTRLLARSTRSLRLTPEGQLYLEHARQALSSLEEGQRLLDSGRAGIRGVLHLSAPSDLGRNRVLAWLDEFQDQHPDVSFRLLLSDHLNDLFREPVDIAIRYGAPEDSSLVALPLASSNRRVLCASPAYFHRRGRPERPEELNGHNCLCFMLGSKVHDRWTFEDGKQVRTVTVQGDRVSDDADVIRRWAVAGRGLVYKSWLDVADDVQAGRLEVALPQWRGEASPLNLLCPHREQLSSAVTQLRELIQARCQQVLDSAPW